MARVKHNMEIWTETVANMKPALFKNCDTFKAVIVHLRLLYLCVMDSIHFKHQNSTHNIPR